MAKADIIEIGGLSSVQEQLDRMSRGLRNNAAQQMAFSTAKVIEGQTKLHLSGTYLNVGSQRGGKSSGRRLRESFTTRRFGRRGALLGTSTIYATTHEFGIGKENQIVLSHYRTNKAGESYRVKTYTRHMKQKERKYFRDAIEKSERRQIEAIQREYRKLTRGD